MVWQLLSDHIAPRKILLAFAQVAGNVSGQALATAAAWEGRTRTLGACAPGGPAEMPAPAALQALLAREPRSGGTLVRCMFQAMPAAH